jgi:hypothetical protein
MIIQDLFSRELNWRATVPAAIAAYLLAGFAMIAMFLAAKASESLDR